VESNAKDFKWPKGCTDSLFKYSVPSVRLETIIRMIPRHLRIEFIKVDAQGADFEVMQSAASELDRIDSFAVEVQTDPLYKGQKTTEDFVEYFTVRGFTLEEEVFQNKHEKNLFFRRRGVKVSEDVPVKALMTPKKKRPIPPLSKSSCLYTVNATITSCGLSEPLYFPELQQLATNFEPTLKKYEERKKQQLPEPTQP
jgi:hypothetical protein